MAFSESQLQEEVKEAGVPGRDITGTSAARTWEHHGKGLLSCHQLQQLVQNWDHLLHFKICFPRCSILPEHIWARRGGEAAAGDSNPWTYQVVF